MWLPNSVEFEPVNCDSLTGCPVALHFSKSKRFVFINFPCCLEVRNGTVSVPTILVVKLHCRFESLTEFETSLRVLLFPPVNLLQLILERVGPRVARRVRVLSPRLSFRVNVKKCHQESPKAM